jgi:hypothetical protein
VKCNTCAVSRLVIYQGEPLVTFLFVRGISARYAPHARQRVKDLAVDSEFPNRVAMPQW